MLLFRLCKPSGFDVCINTMTLDFIIACSTYAKVQFCVRMTGQSCSVLWNTDAYWSNVAILLGYCVINSLENDVLKLNEWKQILEYLWSNISIFILWQFWRDDYLYLKNIMNTFLAIVSNVDKMTKEIKASISTRITVRKWYHLTLIQPLKPETDNTYAISG